MTGWRFCLPSDIGSAHSTVVSVFLLCPFQSSGTTMRDAESITSAKLKQGEREEERGRREREKVWETERGRKGRGRERKKGRIERGFMESLEHPRPSIHCLPACSEHYLTFLMDVYSTLLYRAVEDIELLHPTWTMCVHRDLWETGH